MKSKQITESNINDLIFDANSGDWWVEDGAFKALHSFNLIRTKFLIEAISSYSSKKIKSQKEFLAEKYNSNVYNEFESSSLNVGKVAPTFESDQKIDGRLILLLIDL